MTEKVRLSKLMSQRGLCSRREADRFIEQGAVRVDGEIVNTLGIRFAESVHIELTQEAQAQCNDAATIMFNKPVGIVSAQAEDGYTPAVRLISKDNQSRLDRSGKKLNKAHFQGLAPAGRLDIDSQGLLVLTQNGVVAKRIVGQDSELEKEYLVRIQGDVSDEKLATLRFGLSLDGRKLKRAEVKQLNPDQLQFVLREGRKRQIRRMCEEVGLQVVGLKRVRIGQLRLGALAEGEWRFVDGKELTHRQSGSRTRKPSRGKAFKDNRRR